MDRFDRFKKGGFNRQAAVKALKESVQTGHKTGLPPQLLSLFNPRAQLPLVTDVKKPKIKLPYTGLAAYVKEFAGEGDPDYQPPRNEDRPPSPRLFRNRELAAQARVDTETKIEKKIRLTKWKLEEAEREAREKSKTFDPNKDPKIEGDPYKTIIVARLSYDVTDKKLRREFEEFGPIKRVRIVTDKQGKPRGYAFIEFEHKADMKEAYKAADGKKIEGRRVLVDVERGRTVENWKPRRLGGGLGAPGREPKPPKKQRPGSLPVAPPVMNATPIDDRSRGREYETREPRRSEPRREYDRERDMRPTPGSSFREPPRDYQERSDPRDVRGDRDRKRDREPSPRRDDRADYFRAGGGDPRDDKRVRRDLEDGELRDDRERRERERDRDRRRERDMV
ncbi:hypothetical protein VOLCADRAFT_106420 [Volvox carteri f. nagariensis]|uniref:U1 small nuclear ribonucleoprotein 70 kDa n=1 Tax=Volvox carteri f. nagariensis TaxID=3068 RepID=D8U782_VOLCA|nr:uncharacterized protein VOLCADRAFT_106420 [Volvox carteri f. nagariensis]EFJ44377.1 hypothetical protein VOLCADRAFT_106420 [Volvox carteri f. nagariensis]|eukprot:XP_002954484.1 hypothetical protein VOLCADRAFT_106420 [Volvox carteri f. nagariensis]